MNNKVTQQDITTVLADVASAVVGQFEMESLLDKIINTTMKALHAEVCAIFLEDKEEEPGILKCVAGSGAAKRIVGIARYEIGEGFTGTVAKVGKEFIIRSCKDLKNLEVNGEKIWKGKFAKIQWPNGIAEFRNSIALPLKIKDQILGVIKAENKDVKYGDSFTDEDLNIFKTIANVIVLTIENARLYEQTETQLKAIASKAAHRINNQISSYDGIELDLIDEAKTEMPNRNNLHNLSIRLRETTKCLKNMIHDFRNYGKPIRITQTYNDINKVIADEVWMANPPDSIKINTKLDKTIPKFKFDVARLAESIKEMLGNALRVMQEQKCGTKINISTQLIETIVDYSESLKYVLITIEDDGPGFPPNFPVFSPFHSTDPQRTGLGLATVKETIEAHVGTIEYKPNDRKGTYFEILIPINGGEL
jgi:signal transduction histidine kinase